MLKRSVTIFSLSWAMAVTPTALAQENESLLYLQGDDLESYWVPEHWERPEYPGDSLRSGESGCVAVGYVIETDGSTTNHRALAAFPSEKFNKTAIDAARKFKYAPGESNPDREPVYTTHSITFQIHSGQTRKTELEKQQQALEDLCAEAAKKAITGAD